jgi:hypothetical protein
MGLRNWITAQATEEEGKVKKKISGDFELWFT